MNCPNHLSTNKFAYWLLRYCLVIGTWLLIIPAPTKAQVSMVVSPPRYNLEVKPGEVVQKSVKVTNPSETSALRLRALVANFLVQDDLGTPIQVTESASGRYLASPWFSLDQTEFTLDPRSQALITVIIDVPEDALPGGHYAGVFFEPVVNLEGGDTAAYTTPQVGALFGLTVAGDISYDALIKDFEVKKNLYEFGPVDFTATIENQSDTHITPQSSITISDFLGRQLTTLNLDELNIFPFTARTLSGTWDTVWGLGRYQATLQVAYGPGLSAERTIYFWILPYRLLAAAAVLLLVILGVWILLHRHLGWRSDTRNQEIDELKRRIAELENHRG